MARPAILVLLILSAGACEREPTVVDVTPSEAKKKPKPEPVAPTTGISQIQKGHDEIRAEIAKVEQELDAGEKPKAWLVDQQIKLVDNLIAATEMAMKLEARTTVRHAHGQLRHRDAQKVKDRSVVISEVQEIRRILDENTKGVGRIPSGFTEAELKDRLGDYQELGRKLDKEREEIHAEMRKYEALLKEKEIPPQGETLFTRERVALEETKKRVEAVRARLKDPQ